MPVGHYENFPVASVLLPRRLRPPIEAIYAFARGADDVADEGERTDAERLEGLEAYRRALDAIACGRVPEDPAFHRIARVIAEHALPVALFRDLIDAFAQDVVKKRYATWDELRDYSRRSADPVGRLLLHLFGRTDAESLARSDAICSALQFINFWQDVAVDWAKGRVYIPREDLDHHGVSEAQIAAGRADARWAELMAFECARARALLLSGAPLGRALPGRVGLEIRAVVAGGAAIADKIVAVNGDVFAMRPVLRPWDWARIVARAALGGAR